MSASPEPPSAIPAEPTAGVTEHNRTGVDPSQIGRQFPLARSPSDTSPGNTPPFSQEYCLAGLDEGTFTERHKLDPKTEKQGPKAMIGRRLSQEEAKRLLAKLE